MARDYEKQHEFQINGAALDIGYAAFTTTGATVNIQTPLSQIYGATFTKLCSTDDTNPAPGEELYIADAPFSADGSITPTGGVLTVGRTGQLFMHAHTFSEDDFAANDVLEANLFTAPFDMTIASAVWQNAIPVFTGSPVFNLGTTTTDPDENIDGQAITVTTLVATTFSTFASTAITAGDRMCCLTTDGTGDNPQGASFTLTANRNLVSGLTFMYTLWGID